jgi:hypothetical protein
MEGVTTAIVAFLLLCIAMPHLVKNRPQYYAALGIVLAIIVVDALNNMIGSPKFAVLCYALIGFLQAADILLLFLACGGLTVKELAGEMGNAIEVIRRGESSKEVIIPLSGDAYQSVRKKYENPPAPAASAPVWPNVTNPPAPKEDAHGGSIPME